MSNSQSSHLQAVQDNPVDAGFSAIANEQAVTFSLLDQLQGRLEKVLGPDAKTGGAASGHPPLPTPLLEAIDGRRESALAINERLRWIMDRIVL